MAENNIPRMQFRFSDGMRYWISIKEISRLYEKITERKLEDTDADKKHIYEIARAIPWGYIRQVAMEDNPKKSPDYVQEWQSGTIDKELLLLNDNEEIEKEKTVETEYHKAREEKKNPETIGAVQTKAKAKEKKGKAKVKGNPKGK